MNIEELREYCLSIKKTWNCITLNRDMNDETVKYWVRHSVEEVVRKLPKKTQSEYFENQ